MRHIRSTLFFLTVVVTLSGCSLLGGSDGSDLSTTENITPQPTANVVGPATVADTDDAATDANDAGDAADQSTTAALPTALPLPTPAPTPEPTVDRTQPTTYVVKSGDVLGLIAERFDVDIAELRRVNGLDGNLIRVGQELTIPAIDGATETAAEPDADPTPEPASSSGSSAPSEPVSCDSNATGHCIQPGENLRGIAAQYGITEDDLRAVNPGINGDLIRYGQILNLPGDTSGGGTSPTPESPSPESPTAEPTAATGPTNDAECAALDPAFPYFHEVTGQCHANPFTTVTPTVSPTPAGTPGVPADGSLCEEGFALRDLGDGSGPLCYPFSTPTPIPEPTPTVGLIIEDYGRPPCDEWEVVLIETDRCWPNGNATPAQIEEGRVKTPTPTPTPAS